MNIHRKNTATTAAIVASMLLFTYSGEVSAQSFGGEIAGGTDVIDWLSLQVGLLALSVYFIVCGLLKVFRVIDMSTMISAIIFGLVGGSVIGGGVALAQLVIGG